MSNMIIADDDILLANKIFNMIKEHNTNINIVNVSANGADAFHSICKFKPDILLLDLQMPQMNGLQVLENLKKNNLYIPNLIIITGQLDLLSEIPINSFPIAHVFGKPFPLENLLQKITEVNEVISSLALEEVVKKELIHFAFNNSSRGFSYLVKAISLCSSNHDFLLQIEKNLYPEISSYFPNTNSKKIKWTIDKVIKSMVRYTPENVLLDYFPNRVQPTPKLFIAKMVDLVKK